MRTARAKCDAHHTIAPATRMMRPPHSLPIDGSSRPESFDARSAASGDNSADGHNHLRRTRNHATRWQSHAVRWRWHNLGRHSHTIHNSSPVQTSASLCTRCTSIHHAVRCLGREGARLQHCDRSSHRCDASSTTECTMRRSTGAIVSPRRPIMCAGGSARQSLPTIIFSQRESISTDGSVPHAWRPMGHARRHVVSRDGRVVSTRGSVRHTLRTIISSVRPIPDTHLQARLGRCSLRLVESPLHLGVRLPRSSSWLPPRITGPLRLSSGSPRLAE